MMPKNIVCGPMQKNRNMKIHTHEWKPLSSDAESSDVCDCGAERTILGKIYESKECLHINRKDIGRTNEGMGNIVLYWCPDCGALKRTMINWKYTDYPWILPRMRGTRG